MHLRSLKRVRGEVSLYDPIGVDREGNEITLVDVHKAPTRFRRVEDRDYRRHTNPRAVVLRGSILLLVPVTAGGIFAVTSSYRD